MAPVAIAAVWFGPPWFSALVVVAAVLMAWEWARLCGGGEIGVAGVLVIAGVFLSTLLASAALWRGALLVAAVAALAVVAAGKLGREQNAGLAAAGVLWIAVPSVALLWLGSDPASGRATIFWIFAVVWATDIGAYAVGRTVGGPRLASRVSPSKTWSGLIGGVICAGICGLFAARLLGNPAGMVVFAISAALAVVAQLGDLVESAAKRRFGVKDSSALIPGHGGLLDRLDGLLAVAPVVALLDLLGGSSVLTWR
jgi:phosphatidate cytidylyltransferase